MAYTIGYCGKCNAIFYDPPREVKKEVSHETVYEMLKFNCPVCKEETEFNPLSDLSDW